MRNKDLLTEIREDIRDGRTAKKQIVIPTKPRKGYGWTKVKAGFILLLLTTVGVAYAAERYVDWRAGHQWAFPLRTEWTGFIREIKEPTIAGALAKESVTLTDTQVIEQYRLAPVLKSIYFLESTSGKQDGCREQGKFNGFGYGQSSSTWKCYDTFEQVTLRVNEWLEDRLATNGNNVIEAICFYNRGIQGMNVCDYSENFASVITKNF